MKRCYRCKKFIGETKKSKIIVIPDPHGTDLWKSVIPKAEQYDRIIILGDWYDNWRNNWTNHDQIENLSDAIKFKQQYPEKVIILLGNHDMAYLLHDNTSGHQVNKAIDIEEFLLKNLHHFDIAHYYKGWVFSHAGFSKSWMKANNFHNVFQINLCFHNKVWSPFRFCGYDMFGNSVTQGPTWIRPDALVKEPFFKKQVVGHTEVQNPPMISQDGNIIVIDSPNHDYFHEMEI